MPTTLRIKITAKRQATFPAAALKALRVKPGDYLELIQDKDDWRLAPAGVDFGKLGTLRPKILSRRNGRGSVAAPMVASPICRQPTVV